MIKQITKVFLIILVFCSCERTNIEPNSDHFDRVAMVNNWVLHSIIPGYSEYLSKLKELEFAFDSFENEPSNESLSELKEAFVNAYLSWQHVAIYEIGEAESIGLRNYTNIFPTDIDLINHHIQTGEYNLELPSTRTAQGFPALDYLIFHNMDDDGWVGKMSEEKYKKYIGELINRLKIMATQVKDSWDAEYVQEFSNNRESVDRMVNDYLYYYEKFLRAGKVGIPAGVFSGDPIAGNVEAPYSGIYSKQLLLEALDATQALFNGNSLSAYLEFLDKKGISDSINHHWEAAKLKINELDDNLKQQVETDHFKLLEVYDELQKAVILLKVDMLQALSVQVDYVDADGD